MSWKGFKKAVVRLPENVKQKVGSTKESQDEFFNVQEVRLRAMEGEIENLLAQLKQFKVAVTALLNHQNQVAIILKEQFDSYGETDKAFPSEISKNALIEYLRILEEFKENTFSLTLDLDRRTIDPTTEVLTILKSIRKLIIKRAHKLTDVTRHSGSLGKVQSKTTRDVADEKKLYKYEELLRGSQEEFDQINDALLDELPKLFEFKKEFYTPIMFSFLQIQSRFYSEYFTHMKILSTMRAFNFDSSVIDGFESRRPEFSPLLDHLNTVSIPLLRKNTLKSRFAKKSSLPSNSLQAPSSENGQIDSKNTLRPPSKQRSISNPPPYSDATPASSSQIGSTPNSPIKRPPPAVPPLRKARVLYDFEAQAEGDLNLKENDIVDIIKKTDSTEDWWTGRSHGKIGIFPGNYVELI